MLNCANLIGKGVKDKCSCSGLKGQPGYEHTAILNVTLYGQLGGTKSSINLIIQQSISIVSKVSGLLSFDKGVSHLPIKYIYLTDTMALKYGLIDIK